ncbi:phosphorylcholine transferase LicD1 [Streptococcus pneumoniae]|nr:phosphorylcholine transferase LicD1 [Streptococcus pneumoniae]
MKQLTIEDAKQIELEILDYIDTLCKKHNINYIINLRYSDWGGST